MENEVPSSNSIFLIDTGKIRPNPFQPRKEFDQKALESLADSIKQYGILQPLLVTRHEREKPEGGLAVEYELVSGERRLRAAKLAGLLQVPAIIRPGEHSDKIKLELAIIENLQREDLNPVDRAIAFQKLINDFHYKQAEVAGKVGKSREYVSNSIRILSLPENIIEALRKGEITEGHTRPLLMLIDKQAEQETLFKDIILRRMTVREAERAARRIAIEKVRKFDRDEGLLEAERELSEHLGTKVMIEKRQNGLKVIIDLFNPEDLQNILAKISPSVDTLKTEPDMPLDDRSAEEKSEDDSNLYSVSNFTI